MKHLRLFILVLMSVLLPIRGAVAAAMLCPEAAGTKTEVAVTGQGHHAMHAGHEMHLDHPAPHPHASGDAANGNPPSGAHSTTCHFCASGCCMASIVGTVPSLEQPDSTSSVAFPPLAAPVPAFQSDGQERPPRTI